MSEEEAVRFNNPSNQNDISFVESAIRPVFITTTPESRKYREKIKSLLESAMKQGGVNSFRSAVFWWYVRKTLMNGFKKGQSLALIEKTLRRFIGRVTKNREQLDAYQTERAALNFQGMSKYVTGDRILDLGAGDGLLAREIRERLGKEVFLADVVDYNATDLPLILYQPQDRLPLADNAVDTTVLYTVLHHASDPSFLLDEAARVTKQRLIIKEAYVDDPLSRVTNSFVDWFYNRVIGNGDINVPLNFLTTSQWEGLLRSHGFHVIGTEHVGMDEPLVPEDHVFIIADRAG